MIYRVRDFWRSDVATCIHGRWVMAVPLPYYGGHLRGAWAVLTGRAVAMRYPVSGELEQVFRQHKQEASQK
jgi:hypothetical protein